MIAPITAISPSAMQSDVDLDRVFQEPIDEHGTLRAHLNCGPHIAAKILVVVDQLHRPSAEHE
jgi:hypothetical protein